jgi:hypothetical protein
VLVLIGVEAYGSVFVVCVGGAEGDISIREGWRRGKRRLEIGNGL